MTYPIRVLETILSIALFGCLAGTAGAQMNPQPNDLDFAVNSETTDLQEVSSVAMAADGTFVVVWESLAQDGDGDGIFLRRFDLDGTPLTGDVQVNTTTTGNQTDPDLAFLSGGDLVVVWDSDNAQDGSERGIFGQIFDAAATPVGGELSINEITSGDQNDAVVAALSDGGFLVVWETAALASTFEDLAARRFDSVGSPIGSQHQVNSTTDDDQEDADVDCDGSLSCVAVWESEGQDGDLDGVFARRLTADGEPVGDEIDVNTFLGGNQDDPDLVVLADGRFYVAWEDDSQDDSIPAIFGRAFDSDGTPLTAPFQVDLFDGPEMNPRVSADPEGRALFIWDNWSLDGDDLGVYLSVFDIEGNRRSDEIQVHSSTTGDQFDPHLSVAGGRAATVWTSPDDSLDGIRARGFRLYLFADGFESGDVGFWSRSVP